MPHLLWPVSRPREALPMSDCPSNPWGEGPHHFEFRPGTTVELGADAGYFCVYCWVSLDSVNRAYEREKAARAALTLEEE